jgi:hypothetical protein
MAKVGVNLLLITKLAMVIEKRLPDYTSHHAPTQVEDCGYFKSVELHSNMQNIY